MCPAVFACGTIAAPTATVGAAGNYLLREGDVEGAVSRYSAAIDAAPTGVQAHVLHANRAAAYTRLGKHEQALEDGL